MLPADSVPPDDSDGLPMPGWMDLLLSRLYDGVLSPAGFQAFIDELVDAFECKGAVLYTVHPETQAIEAMWTVGIEEIWLQRYALEFAAEDVFVQHLLATRDAGFQASNLDLVHLPDFEQSHFFLGWLLPQGVRHAAGAVVSEGGGWITPLIVQRSSAQHPFCRDEMQQAGRLLPHLRRALATRRRLAELEQGHGLLASSLDVLAIPTLLLDEQNAVAYLNCNASRILAADDAPLRIEAGRLIAREREANQRLRYEIGCATRASRGEAIVFDEVVRLPRPGRLPLSLLVKPLPQSQSLLSKPSSQSQPSLQSQPSSQSRSSPQLQLPQSQSLQSSPDPGRAHGAALVFLFDPEQLPALSTERARKAFGLTRAEAILATELCRGATLDEIALQRGVSAHTIRTQLKNVFVKTGSNRQSDLVALLLASPAYFIAG